MSSFLHHFLGYFTKFFKKRPHSDLQQPPSKYSAPLPALRSSCVRLDDWRTTEFRLQRQHTYPRPNRQSRPAYSHVPARSCSSSEISLLRDDIGLTADCLFQPNIQIARDAYKSVWSTSTQQNDLDASFPRNCPDLSLRQQKPSLFDSKDDPDITSPFNTGGKSNKEHCAVHALPFRHCSPKESKNKSSLGPTKRTKIPIPVPTSPIGNLPAYCIPIHRIYLNLVGNENGEKPMCGEGEGPRPRPNWPPNAVAYRSETNARFEEVFRGFSRKKRHIGNVVDAASHSHWLRLTGMRVDDDATFFRQFAGCKVVLTVGEYKCFLHKLCTTLDLDYWDVLQKMASYPETVLIFDE